MKIRGPAISAFQVAKRLDPGSRAVIEQLYYQDLGRRLSGTTGLMRYQTF